jgi:hypothetical protein
VRGSDLRRYWCSIGFVRAVKTPLSGVIDTGHHVTEVPHACRRVYLCKFHTRGWSRFESYKKRREHKPGANTRLKGFQENQTDTRQVQLSDPAVQPLRVDPAHPGVVHQPSAVFIAARACALYGCFQVIVIVVKDFARRNL